MKCQKAKKNVSGIFFFFLRLSFLGRMGQDMFNSLFIGNSVSLKVVPVPEFSELSSRTAASQAISPKHSGSPSLMRSSSFLRKQNAKVCDTALSYRQLFVE